MTIEHFTVDQNDVFVPALLGLLATTLAVVLPVVFGPALRRSRRRGALLALAAVVAVAGLGAAGWQAGAGFRALHDDRARVEAQLQDRYGIRLDPADVGVLVDGGKVKVDGVLIHLHRVAGDRFEVRAGKRVVAPQA